MKNVAITLDWNELLVAAHIGILRRIRSLQNNFTDRRLGPSDWTVDIDASAAELGVGKYLGTFFVPTINTFKAPDVSGYQVRSTSRPDGRLIVRPHDADGDTFILVITKAPTVILIGSIIGSDAKTDEFWDRDCWWVPQAKLNDLPLSSAFERAAE